MWKLLTLFGAAATALGGVCLAHSAAPLDLTAGLALRVLVSLLGMGTVLCARRALRVAPAHQSYGSAAFAVPEEIADWCVPQGKPLPQGNVLLGQTPAGRIALPPPYTGQHGLILGGSGTGKSFSFFLPNMAFGTGVSCVATDPKSELWQFASGYHKATRFAPNDPDASTAFNWIPLCDNPRMASLCARAIVEAGETERQEAPWPDLETAFLSALFSHASTLSVPTPLTAYRLLTRTPPESLVTLLLNSDSAAAREQAMIFQQTHERMRGSITPVLAAKLQWMRVPEVERFTSASLAPPDFGRLRLSPEALFWCVREQDIALLRPLSALFFTLLLEQLAAERVGESAVPVHLYLDEFANIGIIPNYATTISLARGRGLSIWHGLQSLSQLEATYGKANAQTILTNCATKIVLHGLDFETAEYASKSLGEGTVAAPRRAFQRRRWALFSSSVSDSVQEHARRLLTADEVRRLGSGQSLVITGNRKPMLLDKLFYAMPPNTASTTALGTAQAGPIALPMAPTVSVREALPFKKAPPLMRAQSKVSPCFQHPISQATVSLSQTAISPPPPLPSGLKPGGLYLRESGILKRRTVVVRRPTSPDK